MSYSFITYAQFRTALAQRLFDSSKLLFSDAELKVYTLESLQTFNALCNFYRSPLGAFNSVNNTTWYDITTTAGSVRAMTTTDLSLINTMEYHLLEPQTTVYPLVWGGSSQFAITDLLNAIQQVRDQLLSETNCTLTQSLVTANTGTTTLPDTTIDIRRVAWIPSSGGFTPNLLQPSDFWSDQSFNKNFRSGASAVPSTYRRSTAPPISFQPDTTLPAAGNFDVLTVNAGATLLTTASTVLNVPNDWTWLIKWGALGQLLGRTSTSSDVLRSNYCRARYKEGIAAMQAAPALLSAQIGSTIVSVTAVTDADHYAANWQGLPSLNPTAIYYAGLNLIALSPTPNGAYAINIFVVRNMVLPSADSDQIQAGRDDIQAILDYAEHIAMFKVGGQEFIETLQLYDNFIRHCRLYNSKLSAQSLYREFMEGRGKRDEQLNPVFTEPNPSDVESTRG